MNMTTPEVKSDKKPTRGTVFVLEDSDPARNVVKFFLEKNNYTVHGFSNGRIAMDFINKEKVSDLKMILSDIMMPEVNGLEFVKQLKDLNKFPGVPIVIMSALSEKDSVLEAKKLGVAGYVVKPISIKKLTEVLRKIFPSETFKDVSLDFKT